MKFKFTKEHFLSDRPIDFEIREIFPEWKEIITSLAEAHAKQANAILDAERAKLKRVWFMKSVKNPFMHDEGGWPGDNTSALLWDEEEV